MVIYASPRDRVWESRSTMQSSNGTESLSLCELAEKHLYTAVVSDSMDRGWVTAYNVPVECGEVIVHPGDFVFADFDGVVVVPKAIVKDVLELASDKVRREDNSRAELMQGAYLRDVFKKYGVL